MLSPIGGAGFSGGMNITINVGGGAGVGAPPLGLGAGPALGGFPAFNDGFSPSSELLGGGGFGGFSPFGAAANPFASLLGGANTAHPGFQVGAGAADAHPGFGGLPGVLDDAGAANLLMGGGLPPGLSGFDGGFPPLGGLGGGGSLANQAMMLQAGMSDLNQASLIGAQTGAMGGLAGAQGTALAGINPLMSGLMANYM